MSVIIEEIEKKYLVENIESYGMQVWPFLRYYIGEKLINSTEQIKLNKFIIKIFVKNFSYGFFNLFRKYNYFVFSDSNERRKIANKWVDKSVEMVAEMLGNTIVFELPYPKHYRKSEISTQFISSKFYFYILEYIFLFLQFWKPHIKDESLLKKILQEYKVNLNYYLLVKKNIAQYKVMTFFIKLYKPKVVFIVCAYTNFGRIKALKDNGIKVVEIQHGVINSSHIAYNIYKPLDKNYYPDYLFSFGEREKKVLSKSNFFIDTNNVIPVGHLYIDYLAQNFKPDEKLKKISSSFKRLISVTSQNHFIEKTLIEFLRKSSELDKENLFIFIPRGRNYSKYSFAGNIIMVDWLNTYEIIVQSDFHSTVFSTCAIEAPSLGIQNILINLNNLSKHHLSEFLHDNTITQYVNTPEDYVYMINVFKKQDKKQIMNSNRSNIVPLYKQNLKKALEIVLK